MCEVVGLAVPLNEWHVFRVRIAPENDISYVLWFLICPFKNPLFKIRGYESKIIRYAVQNVWFETIKLKLKYVTALFLDSEPEVT